MSFSEQHAIETYKSLISISTESFKALQYLNGGAVVAILAFVGQVGRERPALIATAGRPLGLFLTGLFCATAVYLTAYLTQLRLHNENVGAAASEGWPHQTWLKISFSLAIVSTIFFALGAVAALKAIAAA